MNCRIFSSYAVKYTSKTFNTCSNFPVFFCCLKHYEHLFFNILYTGEANYLFSLFSLFFRLILPPLVVIFVVMPVALKLNILSEDEKLMRLIIAVESCSSSAQVMIIALNQIGIPQVATGLAYMYVFQYIASIFTITFWVTVAVSAIYK